MGTHEPMRFGERLLKNMTSEVSRLEQGLEASKSGHNFLVRWLLFGPRQFFGEGGQLAAKNATTGDWEHQPGERDLVGLHQHSPHSTPDSSHICLPFTLSSLHPGTISFRFWWYFMVKFIRAGVVFTGCCSWS